VTRVPGDTPRRIALLLTAALVGVLAGWHASRLSAATALVAVAVTIAPWLAVLPGLLGARRRAYQGAAILTAPYLAYGLMEVLANPGARAWAGATVLVAFALFVSLVHALRASPWPAARTAGAPALRTPRA
jgi:uncharacterized membrane protein